MLLLRHAVALSALTPLVLSAQVGREHDPTRLTNWPAPLYWQPAAAAPQTSGAQSSPPTALVFVAMTPCRVVDTRQGQGFTGDFGPPSIAAGLPVRTIPIQSSTTCSIPATAQAYSFNVTVIPPASLLYITLYPATANPQPAPPNASTLNDPSGTIIANAAIVPAGTDGQGSIDIYASSATDLILDINGYYAPPGDLNDNVALGSGALANNTGKYNTAEGSQALAANTTGNANTATGALALQNNISGGGNTATGGAALQSNTTGSQNTADGVEALQSNISGGSNTAVGYQALQMNTTGGNNTASGYGALGANTTAFGNTAMGVNALGSNTTASGITAMGMNALASNTTGYNSTAVGFQALQNNTTGFQNTALGVNALESNTTGANSTAVGYLALQSNTTGTGVAVGLFALTSNTTGTNNTAVGNHVLGSTTTGYGNTGMGTFALGANTTGFQNTAYGDGALENNTTGGGNVAIGLNALSANTTGDNNVAIGNGAASSVSAGNGNNIHIGSQGASGDSGTIRIGTPGTQAAFFAAGVNGVTTGANNAIPVVVDSNGQLGTVSSSARFKEDIHDMGDSSSGLLQLRPVTFRYKQPFADGSKPVQYGLIAEEVEKVYPDLVAHSADGQIQSVKYQVLDSMLLNELQKQVEANRQQAEKIRSLEERLAALEEVLPKEK